MKNKISTVSFPVFDGYKVRVILSKDVTGTCRRLGAGTDFCIACFIPGADKDKRGHIVFPLTPDEGTIAHEASHAIRELFRWAGSRMDEEAYAYHLDYLVKRIHKFIKRTQCNIQKTDSTSLSSLKGAS